MPAPLQCFGRPLAIMVPGRPDHVPPKFFSRWLFPGNELHALQLLCETHRGEARGSHPRRTPEAPRAWEIEETLPELMHGKREGRRRDQHALVETLAKQPSDNVVARRALELVGLIDDEQIEASAVAEPRRAWIWSSVSHINASAFSFHRRVSRSKQFNICCANFRSIRFRGILRRKSHSTHFLIS